MLWIITQEDGNIPLGLNQWQPNNWWYSSQKEQKHYPLSKGKILSADLEQEQFCSIPLSMRG